MPGRAEVLADARKGFRFLVDEAGCRLTMIDGGWQTVLAYVGDPITFEVELDWREGAAFLLVCRTVDGQRPPGYYSHHGRRMRVHFVETLDPTRADDQTAASELRGLAGSSGPAAMRAQLRLFASALRPRIDRLRSSFTNLFP